MGDEMMVVGPMRRWGTWEELILGGAVLRHGTQDWNVVASELRARTLYPYSFTPEVCKAKYQDLQKRYSGSTAWFEELRNCRVEELKRELARSEDSIESLESKIKTLEAEKQHSNQDGSGQSESPLINSDGTESFGKEKSKDEHSAGSFTKDTRTRTSWLYEHPHPAIVLAAEIDVKPNVSFSSELDKDLSIKKLTETVQGVTIRKRRGQRKRKDCNRDAKEGSVGENDNLGSSNVVFTTWKDTSTSDCHWFTRESSKVNHNGDSYTSSRDDLMEIFDSVALSEPAMVFRHRMDSQKRARYRKLIRRHVDISTIRSRIVGCSIRSAKELFRELLVLANNALVFYSKRTREYKSAACLRDLIMKKYRQHFRSSSNKATSSPLPMRPMCNPPVKPRSARPRPRPHPRKDEIPGKLPGAHNVGPATPEEQKRPCNSELNMSLQSLLKGRKDLKLPGKFKGGMDNSRPKSHVKERKRIRQK
ncbi:bromodomain 4 [Abeliophyllum distichum]|uniref:Bromodomain 4 n=1 Tax=Abeliophyllum distichum TaxID=126358 RepID=A0ABD1QGN8_9LAMI